MNVRQHTTTGDGGADERIEFFISTNGELQVTGRDTLDTEILRGVTWQVRSLDVSRIQAMVGQARYPPASSRTSAVKYSRMALA